jgi:hypothetical protein
VDKKIYLQLKANALDTAKKIHKPSFYAKYADELASSFTYFSESTIIQKCRSYIDKAVLHPAHGVDHCEKVALEAGAIVQIEYKKRALTGIAMADLLLCVHLAGLLHDIKRIEDNHTIAGSIEAEKILNEFELSTRLMKYITAAIRNHEAFKEVLASEDEPARIISDALYDADKFRWGPDNFMTTLWLIIESAGTPVAELYSSFDEKMQGIRRIKNTFRTETGKKHGPEFIDLGIEIGDAIYKEMQGILETT